MSEIVEKHERQNPGDESRSIQQFTPVDNPTNTLPGTVPNPVQSKNDDGVLNAKEWGRVRILAHPKKTTI